MQSAKSKSTHLQVTQTAFLDDHSVTFNKHQSALTSQKKRVTYEVCEAKGHFLAVLRYPQTSSR
jgi:hypothetical protein